MDLKELQGVSNDRFNETHEFHPKHPTTGAELGFTITIRSMRSDEMLRLMNRLAAQGGSGVQNNVNISVSISQTGNAESDSKADSEQGRRIARMLDSKIIEVLARESRPGGFLSNRQ